MGKTRENTGMAADESQKQKKKVIDEARKEGKTVHFASLISICHLEISELETHFQKYKGRVVLRDDNVKDDSDSCAVFTEQGSSASTHTQVKNGRCTIVIENSTVRMSRYLDTSVKTQMAKIIVQHGRPSRYSWAKSVRSSFGRTVMGETIWESSFTTRLGKSSKLGMPICKPRKRTILVCVCGRHKSGWEETKHWPNVVSVYERRWFENQHLSLTMCIWVAFNEIAKRAEILWTITETCSNPESLQQQKKNYLVQGNLTQTSLHGPMIWTVMQRNVWSDVENWRTKLSSNCTKSQLHALMTINSKKKNWNLFENCQTYALKLSWNACIWHALVDQTFYGQ